MPYTAKLGRNLRSDTPRPHYIPTTPGAAGINETQALVAKNGIQNQLSARYYGTVGLASLEALRAGGAPPAALAGACDRWRV